MVPLNYNQLYYFFRIAQCGSIAEASRAELISSPALSMQLKELEENFGTPLFLRVGKKLVLTDAGSIVYEYAKDIFKLGHELRDTISDRGVESIRPKIEIGCQDSIPKSVADELLTFLISKKHCKVIVREGNRETLVQMQNEFKLDLILTNSVPQIHNDYILESRPICQEELVIVGHPKWKKYFKGRQMPKAKLPFIVPTFDSSSRQKIENFFQNSAMSVDVIAEVEDKATEIDLALKGFGLIATMRSGVRQYLEDKSLVELMKMGIREEIWMILGKRKILNPIALFAIKNFHFDT